MHWIAAIALVACARAGQPQEPDYSVVVIIMDDVGPTESAIMPSLFGPEGLASKGMNFTQAYAWPVCSPTRVAMMTGRYPRQEGIGDLTMAAMPAGNNELRLSLNSMGEVFAPHWATGYFGKWHLGRPPIDTGEVMGLSAIEQSRIQAPLGPLAMGFEFEGALIPDVPNSGQPLAEGFYKWWKGDAYRLAINIGTYANDAVESSFLDWWVDEEEAKMAWLSFPCAHGTGAIFEIPPGGTDQLTLRGDYEECVRYLDASIARVLAEIDLETTYVVVTSDNGTPDEGRPEGLPTGFWKGTTFQGGVNVPLIVAGPGVTEGGTSDRVVSLVDLPATMIEVAGAVPMPGMDDSKSFADELGTWTGTPARDFVFTERYSSTYDDQAIIEKQSIIGQLPVRLKLRRIDPDGAGPIASEDIVYDLIDDPTEQEHAPISALPPQIRNRLLAELASVPPRQ